MSRNCTRVELLPRTGKQVSLSGAAGLAAGLRAVSEWSALSPFQKVSFMSKTILVTGASGFIGSHTCVELLQSGFNVVALDNLCNSSRKALDRVRKIAGR